MLVPGARPGARSGSRFDDEVARSDQIVLDRGVYVFLGGGRRCRAAAARIVDVAVFVVAIVGVAVVVVVAAVFVIVVGGAAAAAAAAAAVFADDVVVVVGVVVVLVLVDEVVLGALVAGDLRQHRVSARHQLMALHPRASIRSRTKRFGTTSLDVQFSGDAMKRSWLDRN